MGFRRLNLKKNLKLELTDYSELFLKRKIGILRKHDISMTSALGISEKINKKKNLTCGAHTSVTRLTVDQVHRASGSGLGLRWHTRIRGADAAPTWLTSTHTG